jgi:hypothetical protein
VEKHRPPRLRYIRIFEPEDVISLLRFEIKQAGSQMAWANKTGVDRPRLNRILNGRKPITPAIIRALGLRIVIVSDDRRQKNQDVSRAWFYGRS